MRKFWAAAILALFLAPAAFAGQPFNEDSPEQMTMPPVIVNIDTPPSDNTGAYIAAAATVAAAGLGCLGIMWARKKE